MKINQPGAHLDQMLRQSRAHHVQLSAMADTKANMLMTLSAVVVTLTVPHVFKPGFTWPFAVLIAFCLVTVTFAAYAVMPKNPPAQKNGPPPDVNDIGFNLLFFGDFIRLDYAQYEAAMESMMNDPSRAYEAQVRELYVLGNFLSRKKYRFLRLAYMSFLIGLFASFLTMIVTVMIP